MQEMSGVKPRGGVYYGWYIVAVCVLAGIVVNALSYSTFTMYLQGWSNEFHAPISMLQLCLLGMLVVTAVFCPIVGAWTERFSLRTLLVIGLAGVGVFYFAVSLVHSSWQLIGLYTFLVPLPIALGSSIPVNALISRWFIRRLGLAIGLATFGLGMAGVLVPPLVAWALPIIGWRMIWRIGSAVVIFVVLPLMFLVVRQRPTAREGLHYLQGSAAANPHAPVSSAEPGLRWRDILARRNFWIVIFAFVVLSSTSNAVAQNMSPYILAQGWSPRVAGELLPILNGFNLVATLLLGIFSDRFGNRLPLAGMTALTAAGALIFVWGGGFGLIAAGCALIGLSGGINTLMAAAMAAEFGTKGFGRAYGASLFFVPLLPLTAVIGARVKELTGSYQPIFLGLTVALLISLVLTLLFFREKRGAHRTEGEKTAILEHQAPPVV